MIRAVSQWGSTSGSAARNASSSNPGTSARWIMNPGASADHDGGDPGRPLLGIAVDSAGLG